jgi:hypothetical protein
MAGYLSKVTVRGHTYFRLVESYREDGKVKHRILENYGTHPPDSAMSTVSTTPVSATIKPVRATRKKSVSATVKDVSATHTRSNKVESNVVGVSPEIYTFLKGRADKMSLSVDAYLMKHFKVNTDGSLIQWDKGKKPKKHGISHITGKPY